MHKDNSKTNQNDRGTAPRRQADGDESDLNETPGTRQGAGTDSPGTKDWTGTSDKGPEASPNSDEDEDTDDVDADTDSSATRKASGDVATHRAEDRHGEKRNTI